MRAVRRLKRLAGALVILAAGFVAAALLTATPADRELYPAKPGEGAVVVYVLTNSVHSDLVVPTALLAAAPGPAASAVERMAPTPWTSIGWGDEAFYQGHGWSPARLGEVVRALFGPGNPSVVRLGGVADPTAEPGFPRVVSLTLSQRGFERMRSRLDSAFAAQDGELVLVAPAGPNALFFRGRESFSILQVCNVWTGRLIAAAGVPTTPLLHATSAGLAWDLVHRAGGSPGR